jgi:signal transduction histidine kinase
LATLVAGSTQADVDDVLEIQVIRQRLQTLEIEREQSRTELRRLVDELGRTQERERRRIALDIHDDLQQRLAAIRLAAGRLGAEAAAVPTVRQQALALADRASEALLSTRRIINALRPQILDDLGLCAALEDMVARFAAETGVDARFNDLAPDAPALLTATPLATGLFRVAQEALSNVAKHAQAQEVVVTLSPFPGGRVELRVIDDGCGLRAPHAGAHAALGLVGMRERMRALGGEMLIGPAPRCGTEVIARAPVGAALEVSPPVPPPAA